MELTLLLVNTVTRFLSSIEMISLYTVHTPATLQTDLEGKMNIHNNSNIEKRMCLTDAQFRNEKRYNLGLRMANSLLDKGIISEQDYLEITDKLSQKYNPIFG